MTENITGTAIHKKKLLSKLLKERKIKIAPASCGQRRLWLLDQLEPGNAHYNLVFATELRGDLKIAALEDAFNEIIKRHEILRTTFVLRNDEPAQVIHASGEVRVVTIDLTGHEENDKETEAQHLISKITRQPFDLVSGPLIRVNVVVLDKNAHLLLVTMHHIVTDGWSKGILIRELSEFYRAAISGEQAMLPDLEIQYSDFASWQQQRISDGILSPHLDYWVKQLANTTPLDLPTDRIRPAVQTYMGASLHRILPAELALRIRDFCQLHGVSMYMAMLACFFILLQRYASQDDISVGSPIASRNHAKTEDLIGFFVNILVIRTDLSRDPDFLTLLNSVKETALDAFDHQDLPFEKLVEELQPERNRSISPLFQMIFTVQNTPASDLELTGLSVNVPHMETQNVRFDLEVHIREEPDGLGLRFVYNTDLFDSATIDCMMGHYQNLLAAVISDPVKRISQYNILSDMETRQLLTTWNQTTKDYPRTQTLHTLFEQQVSENPGAIAAEYGDDSLSYAELNCRANQLAHYLQARGVGPEIMVAVCLQRGLEMVVALLGIIKAGGAYAPLDPDYPRPRLAFMLQDTQAPVLLSMSTLSEKFSDFDGELVCLDSERETIAQESTDNPISCTSADNLAYVIYTSGSTGTPKAVLIPHRAINRLVCGSNYFQVDATDRIAQASSFSFDAATFELWGALLNGAQLIGTNREVLLHSESLATFLVEKHITAMFLTTALFNQVAREQPGTFHGLKGLMFGGEAVDPDAVRQVMLHGPPECLLHVYGPTESTTFASFYRVEDVPVDASTVPIGRPLANTALYILDKQLNPVPVGVPGELYIGGDGLARGYLNRPELTAGKFVRNPHSALPEDRIYRTGDKVRYRRDGNIEFLGRFDHQIKVRGFRIEPGEIESVLLGQSSVSEAVVTEHEYEPGDKRLVAYVVLRQGTDSESDQLRQHLRSTLPEYMVPSVFTLLDKLPLTANGKVDRQALPSPDHARNLLCDEYTAPRDDIEQKIVEIWQQLLHVDHVGVHDNFFDLGGHSLLLLQVRSKLEEKLKIKIPIVSLFEFPVIESLARHLNGQFETRPVQEDARRRAGRRMSAARSNSVAIIGMVGRFPGAPDLETFWNNLRDGVESISFFSESELRSAGIDERLLADPNYVPARGVLDDAEMFDAAFFGYTPREATLMDPQQRVFLECAWEALENAGYDPHRHDGLIGVYAGSSRSTDLARLWGSHQPSAGLPSTLVGGRDFLPTQVSYKLDLHGPSVNVQTACSTSLVAVHQACRALIDQDCDMALAGGVSISATRVGGYTYLPSSITSPDGHCRAFDADSAGTVGGEGVGIVVLKRLDEAIADRDVIHAVIRGTAINNDGAGKVGFTAPSVEWQARVVAHAQAMADVQPDSIGYVESHGTGTALGDPIEIAALTQAFHSPVPRGHPCAIGALKSNIGHLGEAAGVAGLIKTVLTLKHRELVPNIHFQEPNPEIDFESSPFSINTELRPWESRGREPRLAGVSSFGIGGTNAHVVVEEAPPQPASAPSRDRQLLVISAKTASALDAMSQRLAGYLETHSDTCLGDVAYTLQQGRRQFSHRRAVVCRDTGEAVAMLRGKMGKPWSGMASESSPAVMFVFPGQGAQYVNMGRDLYYEEPVFREVIDACSEQLKPRLGLDLRTVLYPSGHAAQASDWQLERTALAQPAQFVLGYALARLWMAWAISPVAMMGHGIGEYVAACLAGVMSPGDALAVVAEQGRLIDELLPGSMLAVGLSEAKLGELLDGGLAIASVNGPESCVASGPTLAIDRLAQRLERQGIACHRLRTSHAFHSPMMEPALEAFASCLEDVKLSPPTIPYVSNVTGEWIQPQQATNTEYYCQHLTATVRFWKGLDTLTTRDNGIPLEVGPQGALSELESKFPGRPNGVAALASLGARSERRSDVEAMQETLGRLWIAGVEPNWSAVHGADGCRRVELPTYPFERQRYWIESPGIEERNRDLDSTIGVPHEHALRDQVGSPDGTSHPVLQPRPPGLRGQLVQPVTETEMILVEILGDLLGFGPISTEDDFFDLGVHSLLAIEFTARLRETFGKELPISSIFEAPTVHALGALIDSDEQDGVAENLDALLNEIESLKPGELQAQLDGAQALTNAGSDTAANLSTSIGDCKVLSEHFSERAARMEFSLFFFSADGSKVEPDKYRLLLECARFADQHGFSALWTPERHFQNFGGLYPNPSVLSAALAMTTKRIQIRAGSVVVPLHHPIRIAEEWSLVDNLSEGRVGIALASGWHPQDFVLGQVPRDEGKQFLFRHIQTLRDLWSGETVSFSDSDGHERWLSIRPRPIQETIPIWISIAGNPDTWAQAAEANTNVLTTLGYHSFDDLEIKIRAYRTALGQHGHDPAARTVTVMVHTFLGESNDQVRELVREPMTRYLKGFVKQRDCVFSLGKDSSGQEISASDEQDLLEGAFSRYFDGMSLLGTPARCSALIERLLAIGVNEVACLVDFGLSTETTLDGLKYLDELRGNFEV